VKYILSLSLIISCNIICAQMIIQNGTRLGYGNVDIVIQSRGNLVNNSSYDFSSTNLNVELTGDASALNGNWSSQDFNLNTSTVVNVNGNLSISKTLLLSSGVLHIQTGKVSFSGASDAITINANNLSYVDGPFYQTGTGDRIFPVGTNANIASLRFLDVQAVEEVGVQVFDGDPQLLTDDSKLAAIIPGRYWKITSTDLTQINSRVNVDITGVTLPTDGSPVVVQSNELNSIATDLGSSSNNGNNITSDQPVTASIIAIGKETDIRVKIHDLITPYTKDGVNDGLYIESLELFTLRKVTLLDRWGVPVKTWNEYNNINNYDFSTLSPGNYICIVEYGHPSEGTSKLSQMVTLLKTE
jgi:hypothetical protein